MIKGAKLIGTNPDLTGPSEKGIVPATGALIAPLELTTGAKAYFVGKPNPLMMRHALKKLGCRREDTAIIKISHCLTVRLSAIFDAPKPK